MNPHHRRASYMRPKLPLVVARSLFEAGRIAGRCEALHLRSSEDLLCVNLMCEKVKVCGVLAGH